MNLSDQQSKALDSVAEWLKDEDGPQSFTLGGYAGAGKTTILRRVYEDFGGTCCTPTGKAAAVLASKLPDGADVKTLHSYLYTPDPPDPERVKALERSLERAKARKVEGELAEQIKAREIREIEDGLARERQRVEKNDVRFHPKYDDDGADRLVIVDECSMVPEKVEADLRGRIGWEGKRIRILFVGDPAQLPPVDPIAERAGRKVDFFERNPVNAMLTEVHRQAGDSPILRLATAIRNTDPGQLRDMLDAWRDWNNDCRRVDKGEFRDVDAYLAHDQIITGMNATRRHLNLKLRGRLGFEGTYPQAGERVICLKNDHKLGIVNGVQGSAIHDAKDDKYRKSLIRLDVFYDGSKQLSHLPVARTAFDQYVDPNVKRQWGDGSTDWDFGYAITCHKSQGSEWDSVLIADDEMRANDLEMRRRWIYTAVTRARSKLTWVV